MMEVVMRLPGLSARNVLSVVAMLFVTVVAARAVGTSVPAAGSAVQGAATQKPAAPAAAAQDPVLRGRQLVIDHACGECHGGGDDPAAPGWLAGLMPGPQAVEFEIGP